MHKISILIRKFKLWATQRDICPAPGPALRDWADWPAYHPREGR